MPAGVVAGNGLLMVIVTDPASNLPLPSGWQNVMTPLVGNGKKLYAYKRPASGNAADIPTILRSDQGSGAQGCSIGGLIQQLAKPTGAMDMADIEAAVTATFGPSDPPSVTTSWPAGDNLALAFGTSTAVGTTAQTNYSGLVSSPDSGVSDILYRTQRNVTTQTENPGAFVNSQGFGFGLTVIVRGSPPPGSTEWQGRITTASPGATIDSAVAAAVNAAFASGEMAKVTDLWLGVGVSTLAGQLVPVVTSVAGLTQIGATGYVSGDHMPTGPDAGLNDYANLTGGAVTTKSLDLGAIAMAANTAVGVVGWTSTGNSLVEMTTGSSFPKVTQGDVNRVDFAVHGFGGADYAGPTGRLVGDMHFVRQSSTAFRGYLSGVQVAELLGTSSATPGTGNLRLATSSTGGGSTVAAAWVAPGATYAEAAAIRTRVMAMVAAAGRMSNAKTFVYPGDSLTAGFGATSYVQRLRGLVGMSGRHVNLGLNGQTAAGLDTAYVTRMKSLRPDAVFSPVAWLMAWAGTNDLGTTGAASATVLASLQSLWNKGVADGYSVARFTVLPRADAAWSAPKEAERLALNASIRSNATVGTTLFDVTAIPQLADPNNTTYYNADKVHLTQAGYDLVADFVLSVLAPSGVSGSVTTADAVASGSFSTAPLASVTTLPFTRNPGAGARPTGIANVALAVLTDDANLTRLAGSAGLLMGGDGRLTLANQVPAAPGTTVVVVTREPDGKLGIERYAVA